MEEALAYLTLFASAFLAATIIPAQSEIVLFAFLATGTFSTPLLLLVASTGNILGSCINWLLGRYILKYQNHRWFPVSRAKLASAERWYHRYGKWSLLLSWVPIIGDPITVVAGVLREPFPVFLAIVSIAKITRYVVITLVHQGFFS